MEIIEFRSTSLSVPFPGRPNNVSFSHHRRFSNSTRMCRHEWCLLATVVTLLNDLMSIDGSMDKTWMRYESIRMRARKESKSIFIIQLGDVEVDLICNFLSLWWLSSPVKPKYTVKWVYKIGDDFQLLKHSRSSTRRWILRWRRSSL